MAYIAICSTAWWNNEVTQSRYVAQYPGLSEWITARAGALTEPETVEILGDDWKINGYDVTTVSLGFTNVRADLNTLTIRTVGLARHLGVWNDDRYILKANTTKGIITIGSSLQDFVIDGLQIEDTRESSASYSGTPILCGGVPGALACGVISNNILKHQENNTAPSRLGIHYRYANGGCFNNLILNGYSGIFVAYAMNGANVYNNTIITEEYGISGDSCTDVSNNICIGQTIPYQVSSTLISNNAYFSGIDPGVNGIDLSAFVPSDLFTDSANGDYSLKVTAIALRQKGRNLTSIFDTDIAGQTRFAEPVLWDVGAWHYSGSAVGDLVSVSVQNLVIGSRVIVELEADGTVQVEAFQATATAHELSFEYFEDTLITIKVRRSSPFLGTRYEPYKANAMITSTGVTIYIDQQLDTVVA